MDRNAQFEFVHCQNDGEQGVKNQQSHTDPKQEVVFQWVWIFLSIFFPKIQYKNEHQHQRDNDMCKRQLIVQRIIKNGIDQVDGHT